MKVAVLLAYAVLTTRRVTCAAIQAPLDIISLDDITETDRRHLEYLDSQYYPPRPKRSGDDALNSLKASISHGIKSKLGLLAKGSASTISHFSGSSSGGHGYHHHHDTETYDHHKSLDFWSLKKSILNTLLQAVKAIKGGVIAIKGQLIKGSGYLISAKGKLISSKGEAITNLGKNIATSAVLSPAHGHSADYHHEHYHHSSPDEYGSPSAPGPEYEVPEHHYHHHSPHHEDKPDTDQAGILILKKIPKHESHEHSEHLPAEHKVPDFKKIEHSGPGLGEIIGKFFSASTSLKPGVPAPFDDHDHHHQSDHEHLHSDHDHHHSEHHSHHSDHDHHYHSDHSSHSSHEDYHHEEQPSKHHETHHEYAPPAHSDSSDHSKPSSDYGSPFEEAPAFLNLHEYASESKNTAQTATQAPIVNPKPEAQKLQATPITYDEIRPLPTSFSNLGFDTTSFLSNSNNNPSLFLGSFSNKPNVAFPPYPPEAIPSIKPTAPAVNTASLQYGGFSSSGSNNIKFLVPPAADVGPQVFPRQNAFSGVNYYPTHSHPKNHGFVDNTQLSPYNKPPLKRPTRSKNNSSRKRPVYPSPDFMRSLMYELGPNGPKRL
ncbi:unnamed protein product [Tenebrio molitor]|nr:unnamed protein product [Tenebrio molitor]